MLNSDADVSRSLPARRAFYRRRKTSCAHAAGAVELLCFLSPTPVPVSHHLCSPLRGFSALSDFWACPPRGCARLGSLLKLFLFRSVYTRVFSFPHFRFFLVEAAYLTLREGVALAIINSLLRCGDTQLSHTLRKLSSHATDVLNGIITT
eukprot:1810163-Pleurochrysis_carterae.AAC.3